MLTITIVKFDAVVFLVLACRTSLNRAGEPPVQDYERAQAQFLELVDIVVPGQTSGYAGASAILDINGAVIRGASE